MRNIILFLCLISLGAAAFAADARNFALGAAAVGTFSDPSFAVDGLTNTFAVSGNVGDSPQFLTIDLGSQLYIGSVKMVWDAGALSQNYSIRVSTDKKNWFTEFSELDASKGAADPATNTISQIVSTKRIPVPSRYLQVYIPVGGAASAPQVKIAELQIIPAQNLKFELLEVMPYAVSNNKALIVYRTSIGAMGGEVSYGKDPSNLNQKALNLESGAVNSAVLTDLSPGLVHFYKVKTWDAFGDKLESEVKYFRPPKTNLALNRPVSGTFTNLPPGDPLVDQSRDVRSRVVDGVTSYFKGMATSGPISTDDQKVVIDLGSAYPIGSIVSYWRALAYPESFEVKISGDNRDWNEIAANVNAGEGAFARSDAGDPMRVINTEAGGKSARYIQISIKKNSPFFAKHVNWDFVQLMEVEVFTK